MNFAAADRISAAVLYEGYLLYPYRPDAVKNRQRWTFGGLHPPGGAEPASLRAEAVVRGSPATVLEAQVRFLHLVERVSLGREEAMERRVDAPAGPLGGLLSPREVPFAFPGEAGDARREEVAGVLTLSAEALGGGLYRVRAAVRNASPPGAARLLASTHVLLGVRDGAFVSLLDPPEDAREAVAGCRHEGCFPVLIGEAGATDTLLASPIILYDHPQIAPESPGDLFDATEIDEILSLRILTLSDDERRQLREGDPRARALLERTEALGPAELGRLHGTLRRLGPAEDFLELGRKKLIRWTAGSVEFKPGDPVRLRPKNRADILDLALAGKAARIASIEQDFEDRVFLAVTVDDDPGRDLGAEGMPGHRFFFRPDEVEPIP